MNCDTIPREEDAITEDAVLGGRVRILQPRRGHRAGHDAILLAAASGACAGEHAVDLGAGVGAAGLALAQRVPALRVTLVERDPELVALAEQSIVRNGFADRIRALTLDVTAAAAVWRAVGLPAHCAHRVIMNPPFNDPRRHRPSPTPARAAAHVNAQAGLRPWVLSARRLLAGQGELVLIWRADGLSDVLDALGAGFGALALRPVHPRPGAAAIRLLVRAVKGARAPLAVLPGLVLHEDDGTPTAAAEAVLRNAAALPFVAG